MSGAATPSRARATEPAAENSPPLVAVITPVRNGGRYLSECVESVLAQSYSHWEYVIVNNGSTDDTLEIAAAYAERDPRIRVVDNPETLPIFENWNHALRQASPAAAYCKELHADDWLFPDCLELMVRLAEANPAVGLVQAYRQDGDLVKRPPFTDEVVRGSAIARAHLLGARGCFGSPTSVMIRAELIRTRPRFYGDATIHADTETYLELAGTCDVGIVHKVLTYSRRHDSSVTTQTKDLGTRALHRLYIVTRFGPQYLEKAAYDRLLRRSLVRYVRSLLSFCRHRNWPALRHQRQGWERLGIAFRPRTLIAAVLAPTWRAAIALGRRFVRAVTAKTTTGAAQVRGE